MREETVKAFVIGKMPDRRDLQPPQRYVGVVEIDRGHAFGVGGKIGQCVATAAGNAHHAAVGLDGEAFHVDHRVFPDLGVDEAVEGQRKCLV